MRALPLDRWASRMPRGAGCGNRALMVGSIGLWEAPLCARCWSSGVHFPQLGWILGRSVVLRFVALAGMSEWKRDFILGEANVADGDGSCWCGDPVEPSSSVFSCLMPSPLGGTIPISRAKLQKRQCPSGFLLCLVREARCPSVPWSRVAACLFSLKCFKDCTIHSIFEDL